MWPKGHEPNGADHSRDCGSQCIERNLEGAREHFENEQLAGDGADRVSRVCVDRERYQQHSHISALREVSERGQNCWDKR